MLKLSHRTLIILSGMVWLAVGCSLLWVGLHLLIEGTQLENSLKYPLFTKMAPYIGGVEQAALALIVLGLYIGYMKGRFVLGKAAAKGIDRIRTFPNPTSIRDIYSRKYYLLLGGMVLLGMSIKWLGVPQDVRGFVDVAIGSALINGALHYFRASTYGMGTLS